MVPPVLTGSIGTLIASLITELLISKLSCLQCSLLLITGALPSTTPLPPRQRISQKPARRFPRGLTHGKRCEERGTKRESGVERGEYEKQMKAGKEGQAEKRKLRDSVDEWCDSV